LSGFWFPQAADTSANNNAIRRIGMNGNLSRTDQYDR
jgi:hypothetical protein